jgi:hypothetical protein
MWPTDLNSLSPKLHAFLENPLSPCGNGNDKGLFPSDVSEMIADLERKMLEVFSIPLSLDYVSQDHATRYWESYCPDWS